MSSTHGRAKTGGRKKGTPNKKTFIASKKAYPDALDHLAAVIASKDAMITPDLKVRAAIGLAQYQHPKPTPTRTETFIGPVAYAKPTTAEEARAALLELGERLAKREISVEAHDALISGIKAFLGDLAAEQERRLSALEDAVHGDGP